MLLEEQAKMAGLHSALSHCGLDSLISALFIIVASVIEEPQTDGHLNFDMTSNAKRCRSVQSCQYGRIHHPVTRGKTHHRKRVLVCTYGMVLGPCFHHNSVDYVVS